MSRREIESLTRRYVAEIIDAIGPDKDVPAPDVNTNEQVMAWIMDTYSMHVGRTETAIVTGKPVVLGGSLGPPRGDRPRRDDLHARSRRATWRWTCAARRLPCRASATSGRSRPICSRSWRPGSSPSPTGRAASTTRPTWTSRRSSTGSRSTRPSTDFPGGDPLTNDDIFQARGRFPHPGRPRKPDHARQRS